MTEADPHGLAEPPGMRGGSHGNAEGSEHHQVPSADDDAGEGIISDAGRMIGSLFGRGLPLDDWYRGSVEWIENRKLELSNQIDELGKLGLKDRLLEIGGDLNPLAKSRSELLSEELEALEGLDLTGRQILKIDSAPGSQRMIEVHGDLGNSRRVVITIPGMNTDLADYQPGKSHACKLYDEILGRTISDVAVISFADYKVPDDLLGAASSAGAMDGAGRLKIFVNELNVIGYVTSEISIVAHSYGTVVAGTAMIGGMLVDRVVALGSPGMGGDVNQLTAYGVDLYAASAPFDGDQIRQADEMGDIQRVLDPVSHAPGHGENPADLEFGAKVFEVPDARGHSSYFDQRSTSLRNIVDIALGDR